MSRGIDRTTLLEELVGMLEHKKTREAQRAFHCHGCGEKIDEGGEFVFIGEGGRYCPDCRDGAVQLAQEWLEEAAEGAGAGGATQ